jgi:hypothetical protein
LRINGVVLGLPDRAQVVVSVEASVRPTYDTDTNDPALTSLWRMAALNGASLSTVTVVLMPPNPVRDIESSVRRLECYANRETALMLPIVLTLRVRWC